ncbi:unnamed protein product [Rotaria sordida]|uniref:SSD domain-containing protein n=1 Tax=Rotaria sordida TaxID=392033 RepID=A0A813XYW9_9BILA|nr:unnamed protein product [Rotaria sordida]CAF0876209.1 unnamed protein product [Rotaria sordida]CAF0877857.1 unnamed protein product [Rotaria sordida]
MVCSSHLKAKYVRFLIKYHLCILCCVFIMTSICIIFFIHNRDQIHHKHLLRGFQAHGTKASDEYRKLIALIRETRTTHLYPHEINSEAFQQTPYPSFNPHINPCSKRFYLSKCPILPYTELIFEFNDNNTKLFDDLNTFKSICKLEWTLRNFYTNCSTNHSCCQFIGPVGLLFNDQLISFEQCDNITQNDLDEYNKEWFLCTTSSSSCLNSKLENYLTYIKSSSSSLIFKIYISIENNQTKLLHLYDTIYNYKHKKIFYLKFLNFDINDEEIIFNYYLEKNYYLIYLTICLYLFCLILFIKNFFFILIINFHILLTYFSCFIIYYYLFHFPITILNYTSIILYLFFILIDSYLWYTCWFINKHRRDDCTIQRIIENLLTQTFFYLIPKNITAIITFVITYTNQIIALQCFTVFSFLLISISFFISFILYPASFIFILRYQSSIPTMEHLSHRFITSTTNCFIHRIVPYLIVRLKALWLILLTIISILAFLIIFQWPKLQFNVCRLTFDTLPSHHLSSNIYENSLNSLDIDVTYYIGSHWEVPNESLIPLRDIPILDYNSENKMTSEPDGIDTFAYALKHNLSQLIQFCSSLSHQTDKKSSVYKHYRRHISSQILHNSSITSTPIILTQDKNLSINNFQCFGDLFLSNSNSSLLTNTKFSSYILYHNNQTNNCTLICSLNTTEYQYQCILCLNSLYYLKNKYNDLFLIKNGLRFINDVQNPRYLFQTINYKWLLKTNLNNFFEWQYLIENLKKNFIIKFYSNIFARMSFWWTSEIFSSYTIMKQLQQEKSFLIIIKFIIIFVFLTLFTGILGIFVTLTTLLNFSTCIAIFTLLNYKLTIENLSYFVIILIVCLQYSILYSISYKLAPTFFFQRENRTMHSLHQLCTTLFQYTFSIIIISSPCLFSSLPYLSKSSMVYIISSLISFIYSTFFLQSLLCFFGPAEHTCFLMRWRLTFTRNLNLHTTNNNDTSLRNTTNNITRRHHRTSTSSYFASSYFSQIFTGSTYFESDYGGINENLTLSSRRRESSRTHSTSYLTKRSSLLTGELIELYTPRASLSPYPHNINYHRHNRQSSVVRGIPSTTPARPLYVSPSISPYSQLSIHSQGPIRQRSPSPHIVRPSRSPSPHIIRPSRSPSPCSFIPSTSTITTLRPCYSAPRLHAPIHRTQTTNIKQNDTLFEETPSTIEKQKQKTVTIIQRQNAVSSKDDIEQISTTTNSQLSAATRRNMLKETAIESDDGPVWLKRSNSS